MYCRCYCFFFHFSYPWIMFSSIYRTKWFCDFARHKLLHHYRFFFNTIHFTSLVSHNIKNTYYIISYFCLQKAITYPPIFKHHKLIIFRSLYTQWGACMFLLGLDFSSYKTMLCADLSFHIFECWYVQVCTCLHVGLHDLYNVWKYVIYMCVYVTKS